MKRMQIHGYVAPAQVDPADVGLPPAPPLPPADGLMRVRFIGKWSMTPAWSSGGVVAFGKQWARAALVMQDMEIHVLKVERDALKAQLDELRG